MIETRIYLANLNNWYNSSSEYENLMDCAESEGTVWTLGGLAKQFNNGDEPLCSLLADVNGDVMMCIADIDTETGNIIKVYEREE